MGSFKFLLCSMFSLNASRKNNNRCYDGCLRANTVAIAHARASVVVGKLLAKAGSRSKWARKGVLVADHEPHPH